jgi:ABC-2 type transport system ATP-binding protein
MPVLKLENVTKSYGDIKAVDNITYNVESGRIYGVLGPNGAGKTTTIRMIMNILVPDSGNITLFDQSMNDALKSRIGYLPEERGLYTKMKVIDMLVVLGKWHTMTQKEAINAADQWLKELELFEWRDKKVEELSKGMQQKIQFIGTIMHKPDLLILDEPFSGLDPINTQLIKDIMLRLRDEKRAIMFSTHMMETAEKICDDILLINKGQNVLAGALNNIKKQYGKNAIQIEYNGKGDFMKSLPMVENMDDYGQYVEIILKKEYTSTELLKVLVEKLDIIRFQNTESSLNEIFINLVGRS